MFHEYIPIINHKEYIEHIIGSKYWNLVENDNKLLDISDFCVIKVLNLIIVLLLLFKLTKIYSILD